MKIIKIADGYSEGMLLNGLKNTFNNAPNWTNNFVSVVNNVIDENMIDELEKRKFRSRFWEIMDKWKKSQEELPNSDQIDYFVKSILRSL